MEKNKIVVIVVGVILLLLALKFVAGLLAFVMHNFFAILIISLVVYGIYWFKTKDDAETPGSEKK